MCGSSAARSRKAGEYDLEGLFVRLGYAVDSIGAKRVVLDTIETLFSGFTDPALLRAELRRLFGWIKERGLTAVITGERGEGQLTRQGWRSTSPTASCCWTTGSRTRSPRAGCGWSSTAARPHGTNEYPFLIDGDGISVLPVTSSGLDRAGLERDGLERRAGPRCHAPRRRPVPRDPASCCPGWPGPARPPSRASSPMPRAGGASAACLSCSRRARRRSAATRAPLGSTYRKWIDEGRLRFEAARPSLYGLEMHLARMHRDIDRFRPDVVVVDPISAFRGPSTEVHATLLRMMDLLKSRGITALFTSLRADGAHRRWHRPGPVLADGRLDQARARWRRTASGTAASTSSRPAA